MLTQVRRRNHRRARPRPVSGRWREYRLRHTAGRRRDARRRWWPRRPGRVSRRDRAASRRPHDWSPDPACGPARDPRSSGSMPTIHRGSNHSERNSLYSRSVLMLPDPTIATLALRVISNELPLLETTVGLNLTRRNRRRNRRRDVRLSPWCTSPATPRRRPSTALRS